MSQNHDSDDIINGWRPNAPYNSLPPLPPAEELETRPILKRCVAARAALAELSKAVELIPNPTILINTLPLLEAQASSEIENVVTTADTLFRYLSAETTADPTTKEALRYRHSLLEGFERLRQGRPLSTSLAETVCSRIKNVEMTVRKIPGTMIANSATGRVIYTPPVGEDRLRGLLANWEEFLHSGDETDPLVRMAVGHYQFEAIHPFTDGNGRTGRVLNVLFLVDQGLLPLPVLYLSRFVNIRRSRYYELLHAVTESGDWQSWLDFMLRSVEETAQWTTRKIDAIRALSADVASILRRETPKIYSRELVDVLFEQPYCRIANVVDAGIVQRQAASRHLKALTEVGVLTEKAVGREKLFVNRRLLELLTGITSA